MCLEGRLVSKGHARQARLQLSSILAAKQLEALKMACKLPGFACWLRAMFDASSVASELFRLHI